MKPEQVAEIVKLRQGDPEKYSRKKLAQMYNVSPLFISLVSSVPQKRKDEMDKRLSNIKSHWNSRRTIARDDRQKRKSLWYRA